MKSAILLDFTKTLSSLINSGLTIQEGLEICSGTDKRLFRFSEYLRKELLEGNKFHVALIKSNIIKIPSFYSAMIKIGEESGSVQEVLKALSSYLEKQKAIRQKFIQALLYPAFICVLTIAVTIFVCVFVFPRINDILSAFSSSAEDISVKMENLFHALKIIVALIVLFFLFILLLLFGRKNENIKEMEDAFILRIPIIGTLLTSYSTRDFCFAMKLLCTHGIPISKALAECKNVVSNKRYAKEIELLYESIKQGNSFSNFTEESKVFPKKLKMWFVIGERTGNIKEIFTELHSFYENETENTVTIITNILEPVFVSIAGIILMLFVINFVLPVFNIIGGI